MRAPKTLIKCGVGGLMADARPQPKKRPLVDPSVYELARDWIMENYAVNSETADAASDCLEDAIWDLADAIQREIETWLGDAEASGRLTFEGPMTDSADALQPPAPPPFDYWEWARTAPRCDGCGCPFDPENARVTHSPDPQRWCCATCARIPEMEHRT